MASDQMLRPTGTCWCDCGLPTSQGAFFVTGHDKRAERYLMAAEGNRSIAEKIFRMGYHPGGRSLRQAALDGDPNYEECGRRSRALNGDPCRVIGEGRGIQVHRASDDQHLPD
jgi:hypothetical protein